MSRINLLDWRSERRERRKREFYTLLAGSALVAVGIVVAVMWLLGSAITYQQQRNQYLQQQIADINKQIKQIQALDKVRRDLISRMHVIEQLQQSRSATVHFFDEIVNTLPDGVYLTALKQQGQKVTLEGVAQSNSRVSAYMKNLDASPWFSDPRLIVIKSAAGQGGGARHSIFTLQVKNLTAAAAGGKS